MEWIGGVGAPFHPIGLPNSRYSSTNESLNLRFRRFIQNEIQLGMLFGSFIHKWTELGGGSPIHPIGPPNSGYSSSNESPNLRCQRFIQMGLGLGASSTNVVNWRKVSNPSNQSAQFWIFLRQWKFIDISQVHPKWNPNWTGFGSFIHRRSEWGDGLFFSSIF
jgi:hypothetical protein